MVKINDLLEKLNTFETSDEIAEFLTVKGIKGDVQDSNTCVISNWILTETDAFSCDTTEQKISVEDMNFNVLEIVPTAPVVEFIIKFDDWQYPALTWAQEPCRCEYCVE